MSRYKKFLGTSIYIAIGIVLLYFVYQQFPLATVLETVTQAGILPVGLFALTSIVIMGLHTWRWDVILKTEEIQIPFYKLFLYKIVGFGISFITPFAKVGGEPLRAMLLSRHKVNFDKGMSTVVIDKIIDIITTGLVFSLAVIISLNFITLPQSMKVVLVIISIIFMIIIANIYYQLVKNKKFVIRIFKILRLHKVKKLQPLEKTLIDFDKRLVGFHQQKRKAFYKTVFISTLAWLLMFVEYKAVLWMLGYDLGLIQLFAIITIMGAAYVFPIPLALGVFEFGQAQTFSILGLKAAAGVALSIIIRARDLIWTVLAVIILLGFGKNFAKVYKNSMTSQSKLEGKK